MRHERTPLQRFYPFQRPFFESCLSARQAVHTHPPPATESCPQCLKLGRRRQTVWHGTGRGARAAVFALSRGVPFWFGSGRGSPYEVSLHARTAARTNTKDKPAHDTYIGVAHTKTRIRWPVNSDPPRVNFELQPLTSLKNAWTLYLELPAAPPTPAFLCTLRRNDGDAGITTYEWLSPPPASDVRNMHSRSSSVRPAARNEDRSPGSPDCSLGFTASLL